jgi:hypothetical protein
MICTQTTISSEYGAKRAATAVTVLNMHYYMIYRVGSAYEPELSRTTTRKSRMGHAWYSVYEFFRTAAPKTRRRMIRSEVASNATSSNSIQVLRREYWHHASYSIKCASLLHQENHQFLFGACTSYKSLQVARPTSYAHFFTSSA